MGGSAQQQVTASLPQIENLTTALSGYLDQAIASAKQMNTASDKVTVNSWSAIPSCTEFGSAFTAAMDLYATAIAAVQADISDFQTNMKSILSTLSNADLTATSQLNQVSQTVTKLNDTTLSSTTTPQKDFNNTPGLQTTDRSTPTAVTGTPTPDPTTGGGRPDVNGPLSSG